MNQPRIELLINLYPWKPSMVLFRLLEWQVIYRNKMLLPSPTLDLGCGDGWINHLVLGEDMATVGLDMALKSVQRAKSLIRRVVCGDAQRLPFRHEVFGSIYSNCVIEHLPEIDTCLAEAATVLRPGGILIATVPNSHWQALHFWNRFFSAIGVSHIGRKLVDAYDQQMMHLNLLSPDEWVKKLHKAGFHPLIIDSFLSPTNALFVTFVESIFMLPFPFPGFWKKDGMFYFVTGVLRRIGIEPLWKKFFVRVIARLCHKETYPVKMGAATLLVARKVK